MVLSDNCDEKVFLDYIKNEEENLFFIKTPFKSIKFLSISLVIINNKKYYFSECAKLSFNNQIKIKGIGVQDISDNLMVQIYNEVLNKERLKNKEAQIIICNNSIKSIMLGGKDKRGFNYVKFSSIISYLLNYLNRNNIEYNFVSGVSDDYYTISRYNIKSLSNSIYKIALDIQSSISGYSSIKIVPVLISEDNEEIFLSNHISLEHKGDPLKRFSKQLDIFFENILFILSNFEKIKNNHINPKEIDIILSKIGIGLKLRKFVKVDFNGYSYDDFIKYMQLIDYKGEHGESKEIILGRIFKYVFNEK